MKVGLYPNGLGELFDEIEARLRWNLDYDFDVSHEKKCLCLTQNIAGIDAIIAHPHYDNHQRCWTRISETIRQNPATQFYLFAMGTPEREDFFGERDNIVYVDDKIQTKFFSDPVKFLLEHRL